SDDAAAANAGRFAGRPRLIGVFGRAPGPLGPALDSRLLARTPLLLAEDFRIDRDGQRDVPADEQRLEPMRPIAPDVVFQHAVGADIRDEHGRSLAVEWRPAVRAVEAEHSGKARLLLALGGDQHVIDEVSRRRVATLPPPG